MSIQNKVKQRYFRFLISTRNKISEFLTVNEVKDDSVNPGNVPGHYKEIMYSTRRKLVYNNLNDLRKNIGETYYKNNGLLNEDQLSLLCLYKRELKSIS